MPRSLTFAAVVALTILMSSVPAEGQKAAEGQKEPGIKAEVKGTLHFEAGHGYYITVKAADRDAKESRVWLRVAEDKALVRKLQGLTDKDVVAKGALEQMPEGVHGSVPPLGMYLRNGFEIESAGAK